jgi:serine/threonine protein kinase
MLLQLDDLTALESSSVILIDFGYSRPYINDDKVHIVKKKGQKFVGNIAFASNNACKGYSLSRRDDLISLSLILSYLFDGQP